MNNSFSRCIDQICGHEITSLATYKYSVFGGNTVVLEGHKGICHYAIDKIVFQVGKQQLSIVGEGLQIRCLDKHFAVIVGKIRAVEVSQ